MLELIVFRHAKAAREPGMADHDRPLTERGRRNARAMGEWLRSEGLMPDLALVSDATRARQTFEQARPAFEDRLRVMGEPTLYDATEDGILAVLRAVAGEVSRALVCGHNPGLQDLTTALAGSGDEAALDRFRAGFPTAAVAVLAFDLPRWADLRWGAGRLTRFATPASIGDGGDED